MDTNDVEIICEDKKINRMLNAFIIEESNSEDIEDGYLDGLQLFIIG